jgi:hypothetical protein
MGDDLGAEASKHDGAKMMVRVMMRQDQPLDRLSSNAADSLNELCALLRTGQGVDHYHPCGSHTEAGIGSSFRSPARVPQRCVNAWPQTPDRNR